MDEVEDLKTWLRKKEGEPLALSYKLNIGILNVLWSVTCGRWEKWEISALCHYSTLLCSENFMLNSRSSRQFMNALTNSLRLVVVLEIVVGNFQYFLKVHVPGGYLLVYANPDQDPARVHHQHREGPLLQVCGGVGNKEDDDGDGVTGIGSTRSRTSGSESTGKSTGATGRVTSRTPTWTGSTLERSTSPQRSHTLLSTQVRILTRVF